MIKELVTLQAQCDRKGCGSGVTVCEPTAIAANGRLYDLGWRLARGKLLCPRHVAVFRGKAGLGLFVRCPHCGSMPGAACRGHHGYPIRQTHMARVKASE